MDQDFTKVSDFKLMLLCKTIVMELLKRGFKFQDLSKLTKGAI